MLLLAEMSRSPRSSISPELRNARTPFTNDGDTQVFHHVAATMYGIPGIVQYFSFSPKQAVVHPRVCPPHNCAQMVRHRVLSASRRLCLGSGSWEMQQLTQETWDYAPKEREREGRHLLHATKGGETRERDCARSQPETGEKDCARSQPERREKDCARARTSPAPYLMLFLYIAYP